MPAKKKTKGTRSAVRTKTPRSTAAGRGAKSRAATSKSRAKTSARRTAASQGAARSGKKTARGTAGTSASAIAAVKSRFEREKTALEKRLTESVREIGQLRHHEARVAQLERQLKERDETIGQLRSQVSELRNRDLDPHDDEEVQPSLALGSRSSRDIDDLEDDLGPDDDDELI
jgi:predicted RNase H-like nuclease (RuvC/YqgF family)